MSMTSVSSFDHPAVRLPRSDAYARPDRPLLSHEAAGGRRWSRDDVREGPSLVTITPPEAVTRQSVGLKGVHAELVRFTGHERVSLRFRAPVHLLVAYEQGERSDGETIVDGAPRSTLRDLARKLTLVPAGHEFREWHEPRTLARLLFFYIDPAVVAGDFDESDLSFGPRLFFDDAALRATAIKLKRAIENPCPGGRLYADALGTVLVHELVRLNGGARVPQTPVRGGLAAWQERTVAAYIDEHMAEQVPLATLAKLVRLSMHYFCRAFRESFGVPPHRYLMMRRIEAAKTLLARRSQSVTEIGLVVGYSETSSFTAAFGKVTGLTPTAYQRSLS
jgi:AraC family transcriptional regulator